MGGLAAAAGAAEGRREPGRAGAASAAPVLRLHDLDYELPPELSPRSPAEPRDASRLLVVRAPAPTHASDNLFRDLPGLLRAGDVLVRNDTRVFPARSFFRRRTGGRIEALFLRARAGAGGRRRWEVLLRGRPRAGEVLAQRAPWATSGRCAASGRWATAAGWWPAGPCAACWTCWTRPGVTPLPPYIHDGLDDPERYQTTYARAVGSAAAPTAGLHFTAPWTRALRRRRRRHRDASRCTWAWAPSSRWPTRRWPRAACTPRATRWTQPCGARLRAARAAGRRLIAVGTTSLRVLETLALQDAAWPGAGRGRGGAAARIAPGPAAPGDAARRRALRRVPHGRDRPVHHARASTFRAVDGLLTNFHLPRTSLLALVMAFCGVEQTRRLYRHAVAQRYRFYSFGDAMLAL